MPNKRFILFIISSLFFVPVAQAGESEWAGFTAIDARGFLHAPQFAGQENNTGLSLVLEPEYYYISDDDKHVLTARFFGRYDPFDDKRSHVDIRQLDWLYEGDGWELRAGASKIFWGVTESRHLVDIINQDDAIEDTDGEDKLGQPMLQLAKFTDYGTFRLFYLPYTRERTFAGRDGRLRTERIVDNSLATYDASAEEFNPDIAFRYETVIGSMDLGLAHFSGNGREPVLREVTSGGQQVLQPVYQTIDQTSIDAQYTTEGWLWKLEALTRGGNGKRFEAVSGGFEYTLYGVMDTFADAGLLMEYHHDNRGVDSLGTFFDHDAFIGTRITLNDVNDTEFLGGVVYDVKTHARFFNIEFARRLNDRWKTEIDARMFTGINANNAENSISQDDFIQLRLSRYF
jgi:hypothetical protein